MVDPRDIPSVNISIDRGYGKKSERIDHEYTGVPVCPWCGWKDNDWWDGSGLKDDGDTEKMECGDCEKPFETTMYISRDFCTKKRDIAEEERVEAERKERAEENRLKRLAGVETFTPGTRVKVVQKKYPTRQNGRVGTVANEEINKRNPYVRVNLDGDNHKYSATFDADELERVEE